MNPIAAEILSGRSLIQRAKIPPTAANGIAVKMSMLYLTELNAKYKRIKMRTKASGIAMPNLLLASCRFSNEPP